MPCRAHSGSTRKKSRHSSTKSSASLKLERGTANAFGNSLSGTFHCEPFQPLHEFEVSRSSVCCCVDFVIEMIHAGIDVKHSLGRIAGTYCDGYYYLVLFLRFRSGKRKPSKHAGFCGYAMRCAVRQVEASPRRQGLPHRRRHQVSTVLGVCT